MKGEKIARGKKNSSETIGKRKKREEEDEDQEEGGWSDVIGSEITYS